MEKEVVFSLLILCGIVFQEICTEVQIPWNSEENEKSFDPHIRTKRLVGNPGHIADAPFLVSLIVNGVNHCPATLLTNNVAITSAECLQVPSPRGRLIQAGSAFHRVMNVIPYRTYNSSRPTINNLALLFFHPNINYYTTHNRPINIYTGHLAAELETPIVYNWDHEEVAPGNRRQSVSEYQTVDLQFINIEYCQGYYPNRITSENICTQSLRKAQHCEHMDSGAPLTIRSRQSLVGIFAYRGQSYATDPDVFMNLLDQSIRRWIHLHVPTLRLL